VHRTSREMRAGAWIAGRGPRSLGKCPAGRTGAGTAGPWQTFGMRVVRRVMHTKPHSGAMASRRPRRMVARRQTF